MRGPNRRENPEQHPQTCGIVAVRHLDAQGGQANWWGRPVGKILPTRRKLHTGHEAVRERVRNSLCVEPGRADAHAVSAWSGRDQQVRAPQRRQRPEHCEP